MATLREAEVGDTVTVAFKVVNVDDNNIVDVRSVSGDVVLALSCSTAVESIKKAPPFSVGDRVSMQGTVPAYPSAYYRKSVTKYGVIKFIDNERAWVAWDKPNVSESLVQVKNLKRAK